MKYLRDILFCFAVALGFIVLSGIAAWANDDASAVPLPIWRQQ